MPYLLGNATKASSAITNSSGLAITIPAMAGLTIRVISILILNGPSLVAINDNISLSNVDQDTPVEIPLTQLLSGATTIDLDFAPNHLVCSGQNTSMVLTVPVLLGGAYTFVKIDFEYV